MSLFIYYYITAKNSFLVLMLQQMYSLLICSFVVCSIPYILDHGSDGPHMDDVAKMSQIGPAVDGCMISHFVRFSYIGMQYPFDVNILVPSTVYGYLSDAF